MSQSKKASLVESVVNVVVGLVVAIATQMIAFPLFGIDVTIETNFWVAVIFTIVSLVRSYVLRRIFNKLTG